jgi:hypothetical protein
MSVTISNHILGNVAQRQCLFFLGLTYSAILCWGRFKFRSPEGLPLLKKD